MDEIKGVGSLFILIAILLFTFSLNRIHKSKK